MTAQTLQFSLNSLSNPTSLSGNGPLAMRLKKSTVRAAWRVPDGVRPPQISKAVTRTASPRACAIGLGQMYQHLRKPLFLSVLRREC